MYAYNKNGTSNIYINYQKKDDQKLTDEQIDLQIIDAIFANPRNAKLAAYFKTMDSKKILEKIQKGKGSQPITKVAGILKRTKADYDEVRKYYPQDVSLKAALSGLGVGIFFDAAEVVFTYAGWTLLESSATTALTGVGLPGAVIELVMSGIFFGFGYGVSWTTGKITRKTTLEVASLIYGEKTLIHVLDTSEFLWTFTYKPNPNSHQWQTLTLYDIARLSEDDYKKFQQHLDRELISKKEYSVELQNQIYQNIDNAKKARIFFEERGTFDLVPPKTFEYFVTGETWEDHFIKELLSEDPLYLFHLDQNHSLATNWTSIDLNNALGLVGNPEEAQHYQQYLNDNQIGFNLNNNTLTFTPSNKPTAPFQSSSSDYSSNSNGKIQYMTDPKILAELTKLFDLGEKQNEKLDQIMGALTIEVEDKQSPTGRKKITLGEYFSKKIQEEDQLAKSQKRIKETYAGFQLFGYLGKAVGSEKMVQYATTGSAVYGVALSVVGVTTNIYSPMAWVSLIESVTGFIGILKKPQQNDLGVFLQKQLQQISEQLVDIKELVTEGFLKQEQQLQTLYEHTLENFQTTLNDNYISRLTNVKLLTKIQTSIYQLSQQLDRQIAGLWLNDLIETIFNIKQHKSRYNDLSHLSEPEYNNALDKLVFWMLDKSMHYNATGAHLYYKDQPADHALIIINSSDVYDIVGFLAQYARHGLGHPIISDDTLLTNINIWSSAFKYYHLVLLNLGRQFYHNRDPYNQQLIELIQRANQYLSAFHQLRNDYQFFLALASKYANTIRLVTSELKSIINILGNKKANEILKNKITDANHFIQRMRANPIACKIGEVPTNKHEPKAAIKNQIQIWDTQVAPKIHAAYLDYISLLWQTVEQAEDLFGETTRPLDLFIKYENDLLPIDNLFSSTEVKFPEELVIAEQQDQGKFAYELNADVAAATFVVKVTFQLTQSKLPPIPVAEIYLKASITPEIITQMSQYLYLNIGRYAESTQGYARITTQAFNRLALLIYWQHAQVTHFNQHHLDEATKQAISTNSQEVKLGADLLNLIDELKQGTTKPVNLKADYSSHFFNLKDHLDELELMHKLFQAYAKLALLPEIITSQLKLLWNKDYVINLIMQYDAVRQKLTPLSLNDLLTELTDEHLTETQSRQQERFSIRSDVTISRVVWLLLQAQSHSLLLGNNSAPVLFTMQKQIVDFLKKLESDELLQNYENFQQTIANLSWDNFDYKPQVKVQSYSYDIYDMQILLNNLSSVSPTIEIFHALQINMLAQADYEEEIAEIQEKYKTIFTDYYQQNKPVNVIFPIGFVLPQTEEVTEQEKIYWMALQLQIKVIDGIRFIYFNMIDPGLVLQRNFVLSFHSDQGYINFCTFYENCFSPIWAQFIIDIDAFPVINCTTITSISKDSVNNIPLVKEPHEQFYRETGPILIEHINDLLHHRPLRSHNWDVIRSRHNSVLRPFLVDTASFEFGNGALSLRKDPWLDTRNAYYQGKLYVFDEYDTAQNKDASFLSLGISGQQGLHLLTSILEDQQTLESLIDDILQAFTAKDAIWENLTEQEEIYNQESDLRTLYFNYKKNPPRKNISRINGILKQYKLIDGDKNPDELIAFLMTQNIDQSILVEIQEDQLILVNWHQQLQSTLNNISLYLRQNPRSTLQKYLSYLASGHIGVNTAKLLAMQTQLFDLYIWKAGGAEGLLKLNDAVSNSNNTTFKAENKHSYHLLLNDNALNFTLLNIKSADAFSLQVIFYYLKNKLQKTLFNSPFYYNPAIMAEIEKKQATYHPWLMQVFQNYQQKLNEHEQRAIIQYQMETETILTSLATHKLTPQKLVALAEKFTSPLAFCANHDCTNDGLWMYNSHHFNVSWKESFLIPLDCSLFLSEIKLPNVLLLAERLGVLAFKISYHIEPHQNPYFTAHDIQNTKLTYQLTIEIVDSTTGQIIKLGHCTVTCHIPDDSDENKELYQKLRQLWATRLTYHAAPWFLYTRLPQLVFALHIMHFAKYPVTGTAIQLIYNPEINLEVYLNGVNQQIMKHIEDMRRAVTSIEYLLSFISENDLNAISNNDLNNYYAQTFAKSNKARVFVPTIPKAFLFDRENFLQHASYDGVRTQANDVLSQFKDKLSTAQQDRVAFESAQTQWLIEKLLNNATFEEMMENLKTPTTEFAYYLGNPDILHVHDCNFYLHFRIPLILSENFTQIIYQQIPKKLILAQLFNLVSFSYEYTIKSTTNNRATVSKIDISLYILHKLPTGELNKQELMSVNLTLKVPDEYAVLFDGIVNAHSGSRAKDIVLKTANLIYAFGIIIPILADKNIVLALGKGIDNKLLDSLENNFHLTQKINDKIQLLKNIINFKDGSLSKNSESFNLNLSSNPNPNQSLTQAPAIQGLIYQPVFADGHCLYHAVGLYLGKEYTKLREEVAAAIRNNPADYCEFITALNPNITIEQYLDGLENKSDWADDFEISVLMRILNRPIVIIEGRGTIRNAATIDPYRNGDPIFVYYNGINHYDAYLFARNVDGRQILDRIDPRPAGNQPASADVVDKPIIVNNPPKAQLEAQSKKDAIKNVPKPPAKAVLNPAVQPQMKVPELPKEGPLGFFAKSKQTPVEGSAASVVPKR